MNLSDVLFVDRSIIINDWWPYISGTSWTNGSGLTWSVDISNVTTTGSANNTTSSDSLYWSDTASTDNTVSISGTYTYTPTWVWSNAVYPAPSKVSLSSVLFK